jgi:hypothetical protein
VSILQGLFTFRNIKKFTVHYSFDFDDHVLKQLAIAWPQLHTISLRTCNRTQQSRVTLKGLMELIAGCPGLQGFLEIDIHVRHDDLQALEHKGSIVPNSNITMILFNHSTCEAKVRPEGLSMFLQKSFPLLEEVDCFYGQVDDFSAKVWGTVTRLIKKSRVAVSQSRVGERAWSGCS